MIEKKPNYYYIKIRHQNDFDQNTLRNRPLYFSREYKNRKSYRVGMVTFDLTRPGVQVIQGMLKKDVGKVGPRGGKIYTTQALRIPLECDVPPEIGKLTLKDAKDWATGCKIPGRSKMSRCQLLQLMATVKGGECPTRTLEQHSKAELIARAKELEIRVYSRWTKADLVAEIKKALKKHSNSNQCRRV
jgi:hypothetical protein